MKENNRNYCPNPNPQAGVSLVSWSHFLRFFYPNKIGSHDFDEKLLKLKINTQSIKPS
jgi:hypothetical protein